MSVIGHAHIYMHVHVCVRAAVRVCVCVCVYVRNFVRPLPCTSKIWVRTYVFDLKQSVMTLSQCNLMVDLSECLPKKIQV